MKLLVRFILILVAAGIGLAIGSVWRGKKAQEVSVLSGSTPQGLARPSRNNANKGRALDDSPLAAQLEKSLSLSSGVRRWLYWLEAIEKATPRDFPRLAMMAKNDPAALRFVTARWIEVAPRHLFDTLVSSWGDRRLPSRELEEALFNEWPKTDPDAAIAALSEGGNIGRLRQWRHEVANIVIGNDAERGLLLFSDWGIQDFGPQMGAVAKWAAADPLHAAEFTLEHSAGYVSQMAMDTIGKEWAKTDPAGALAFATAKPGELGTTMETSVVKQWAKQDLDGAAQWLAAADQTSRNAMSPAFAEIWAKQNASDALAWCEQNLSGNALTSAVRGVLQGAAAKDVTAAAGLVTGMEPSPARAEAAAAVVKQWFPNEFSGKAIQPEAIEWLATLDPDSIARATEEVQWQWSAMDAKSMASFLADNGNDKIPDWTYSILARELARKDPVDALRWADEQGPERGIAVGGYAFAEWWEARPDDARKWLDELPANDPRRDAFFEKAVQTMAYDTRGVAQLTALTGNERDTARTVISGMTLPEDRRIRLLEALRSQ